MADAERLSLPEQYRKWIANSIDEQGVGLNHALLVDGQDAMTVFALDLPPAQAYTLMLGQWAKPEAISMIFALDRFAKPDQGTTLGDLVAGFYCPSKSEPPRPFIIEYQHAPRLVKPIDWSNVFWNAALLSEMVGALRGHLGVGPLR